MKKKYFIRIVFFVRTLAAGAVVLLMELLCMAFLCQGSALAADNNAARNTIAIFILPQTSIQINALLQKSSQTIADTFSRLGRFHPIGHERLEKALEDAAQEQEPFQKAAEQLKAGCYAIVSVHIMGNSILANVTVIPISERYGFMKASITVQSMIPSNIPLKLAREIALLHKNLAVEADIVEKLGNLHIVSAGQWHGLTPGRYYTVSGKPVIIQTSGRFESIALLPDSLKNAKQVTIQAYPSTRAVIDDIDNRIDSNTNYRYSLISMEKGIDPEKKFVEGIFIINPGANIFLPGYGAYLSTSYMGFKNTTPSIPGIVFSTVLILTHYILPECMTKFKINFFPGIMDRDKTRDMNNLQIFCWATTPLSATAAFLDQLAHQCSITSILPPFFMYKNEAALMLSFFIPGGGMFYKGYRLPGWSFYLSEMFLAGFCVYSKNDRKKIKYASIALGGVKLVELVASYFSKPSYGFYNLEKEGQIQAASLSMFIKGTETGELVYNMGMSFRY